MTRQLHRVRAKDERLLLTKPRNSQSNVPAALTCPHAHAEAGSKMLNQCSQESMGQYGRRASIELGSRYMSMNDYFQEPGEPAGHGASDKGLRSRKAGKKPSLVEKVLDTRGGTTPMAYTDGGKETGDDGTVERKHKNKNRQRRILLAIAKTRVGGCRRRLDGQPQ